MRCSACGHENRPDRRFCTECGAPLGTNCPSCGVPAVAGEKFCGECGASLHGKHSAAGVLATQAPVAYTPRHLAEKILTSRAALEGERKQVTVLFADVKGSLELASQVDPEEWHRILDGFFQILADGVHRYEGTVNQYTGDGIMALFGAPLAHEDHAQRACWAALHLGDALTRYAREVKRRHGLAFAVRMGLNSGDVVVGRIGDDLRMDYTAQGHTVGLAARMEQLADPGKAYLTAATATAVAGYFRLEDLGTFEVKGVAEPLRVYELAGPGAFRSRFDVSRARGLTRFVGREADVATLDAALARAREGDGQVVGVVGEAGVGKSRLCFELLERCRACGLRVLEGRALSHTQNVPLATILRLLRAWFGIGERDDERTVREKIAGRLLLLDEGFRAALPVIFDFVGAPDPARPAPELEPEARQRQLFTLLRRLVQAAQGEPTVTLIEDLHWIDAASAAFLAEWVEAIAGSRSLLVVNFRPEYQAEWMRKSYYQRIALAPLGAAELRELLADLLGRDPSVARLPALIHERTVGNPFFAEEVVQALAESGALTGTRGDYRLVTAIEKLTVPPTVQAVLAARIDRLPEREKQVLAAAAVIGKEFDEPTLQAVAELVEPALAEALAVLERGELVYQQAVYPLAAWAFKHPLTQEVAYGAQLGERRRRTHGAVARALADAHRDAVDEDAPLIAQHWEQAGETLEAMRWHGRAAEWLWQRDRVPAIEHWQRVLTLVNTLPEDREVLALGLRARVKLMSAALLLRLSAEEVQALAAEGRRIAESLGDIRGRFVIEDALVVFHTMSGSVAEATDLGERQLRIADGLGDAESRVVARGSLGSIYDLAGRLVDALRVFDEAIEIAGDDLSLGREWWGASLVTLNRSRRARIRIEMGQPQLAVRDLEAALEGARAIERTPSEFASVGWSYVTLAEYTGETEQARRWAAEAIDLTEYLGQRIFSRLLVGRARLLVVGRAHLLAGAPREAVEALAGVASLPPFFEAARQVALAEAHLATGDADDARAAAEEAVRLARVRGMSTRELHAERVRARVLRVLDGARARPEIEACLARADTLVAETGARAHAPFILEERARLATVCGDAEEGRRLLHAAERAFVEVEATGHAARLARELDG